MKKYKKQSKKSIIVGEVFNSITHGIGTIFAITSLVLLIIKGNTYDNLGLISFIIYGISNILLFLASTLYHALIFTKVRMFFRRLDHASIYVLIAGTYTPFCLVGLRDTVGIPIFIAMWIIALVGILLKIFMFEKFEKLSILLYLAMGWAIVFTLNPIYKLLGLMGTIYLVLGGISYTIGVIFYKQKHNNFYHVVWHLFVLLGAMFMFISVYFYL